MNHLKHICFSKEVFARIKEICGTFPAFIGLVLILFLLSGFWYLHSSKQIQTEFSGKIVDKWISSVETDEGTKSFKKILIENKDGGRFTISPPENVYQKTKVGDSIEKKAGEIIVLSN